MLQQKKIILWYVSTVKHLIGILLHFKFKVTSFLPVSFLFVMTLLLQSSPAMLAACLECHFALVKKKKGGHKLY